MIRFLVGLASVHVVVLIWAAVHHRQLTSSPFSAHTGWDRCGNDLAESAEGFLTGRLALLVDRRLNLRRVLDAYQWPFMSSAGNPLKTGTRRNFLIQQLILSGCGGIPE